MEVKRKKMMWIIILPIIGGIMGWKLIKGECVDYVDYFFGVLAVAFGAFLFFLLAIGISVGIGLFLPSCYVQVEEAEIVAIDDIITTEGNFAGNFFVGIGTIEGKLTYIFYQKENDNANAVKLRKVSAENTIIFEEERSDGQFKKYIKEIENSYWYLIAIPIGDKYEIFVPKGTINREFNLDL